MKSAISTLILAGVVRAAPAATTNNQVSPYSTPNLLNLIPRSLEIGEKRKGWLYDYNYPFGGAPYPYGTLANKTIDEQLKIWKPPVFALGAVIVNETQQAVEAVIAVSRCCHSYYRKFQTEPTMSKKSPPYHHTVLAVFISQHEVK
jgi:hypothetical protein